MRDWMLEHLDDDTRVSLSSYAGGANPVGHWGALTLMREAPDGTVQFRDYVAAGPWKDSEVVAE